MIELLLAISTSTVMAMSQQPSPETVSSSQGSSEILIPTLPRLDELPTDSALPTYNSSYTSSQRSWYNSSSHTPSSAPTMMDDEGDEMEEDSNGGVLHFFTNTIPNAFNSIFEGIGCLFGGC